MYPHHTCSSDLDPIEKVLAKLKQQLRPGKPRTAQTLDHVINTVRPYKGYAAINYDIRSASANYNLVQVDARRHFKNGFPFEAAYTYSRSLGSQIGQNQFANKEDPTTYDRPQSFTINYVYDLPFFRGSRSLAPNTLGGWRSVEYRPSRTAHQ